MKFLGVDTSSGDASVAIVENGRVLIEKCHSPVDSGSSSAAGLRNHHAEILIPLIESSLRATAISLSDISGFGVAIGPGSFTGLRIGLSTVKGLAYASGNLVVGISTLHAFAARVKDLNGVICTILDARKKEVYAATFRSGVGTLNRLSDDAVMPIDELVDILHGFSVAESIFVTGTGIIPYGEVLAKSLGNRVQIYDDKVLPTLAATVALLGEARLAQGADSISAFLTPQYLRSPQAEVNAQKIA